MDVARQSAVVGAVLGACVALMGAAIVALAADVLHAPAGSIHVPRFLLGLIGLGVVFCGMSFALSFLGLASSLALAVPGVALAFVLPLAWFAFGPGVAECSVTVSLPGGAPHALAPLAPAECRAWIGSAALGSIAIVVAMAWAARRLVRRNAGK